MLLTILIIAYIFFFVAWSIEGVNDNISHSYPKWIIIIDVMASSLAFFGMVIFLTKTATYPIVVAWRSVFWFIIAWTLLMAVLDYKHASPQKMSNIDNKVLNMVGVVFGISLLFPCLIINYLVAY